VNDDDRLIDETLAGRSASFGLLVQKYQDRLYHAVVHVLGSREDARDVVQEACVQAFVKLDSFRRSSAFYTWLYRIALNMASSRRRRMRPTVSVEQTREATGDDPVDDGPSPDSFLEQDERARQVRRALATLSEEHRTILVLREMDGCCYETIAEMLDLPVGTVRSRLHRARLQLRNELREVLHAEGS
jgi:RNA polymerase sigma-70 factor (ECF subfamily)